MQLRDTQSMLANNAEKVRGLDGVIAEHDAIKCEVGLLKTLRQFVERWSTTRDREQGDFLNQLESPVELSNSLHIFPEALSDRPDDIALEGWVMGTTAEKVHWCPDSPLHFQPSQQY
jgi:hypothetical protein